WILQNWGWRNAFYLAAVPGVLCAVAALMVREPKRGTLEQHAVGDRVRPGNPYRLVLSIPTMLWIIVSGALHNFNMYALGSFVAPYLVRFHHMNFLDAGWVAACVYGLSCIVGRRGGRPAAVRCPDDGGGAESRGRIERLRSPRARAVPRRWSAHGHVHRPNPGCTAGGGPLRGVAHRDEGRRPAAGLDALGSLKSEV